MDGRAPGQALQHPALWSLDGSRLASASMTPILSVQVLKGNGEALTELEDPFLPI